MALFKYKAISEDGKLSRGQLEAVNETDLESRLGRLGLDLVNFSQVKQNVLQGGGSAVPRRELITFCFHLEQMTRAGVPLLTALEDLRDSAENPRLREVTSVMVEEIDGGKTLSEAMEEFPRVFDKVFSSLVRAGEQSGQLPAVLKSLNDSLKWQDETASYTKRILMYPMFVGVVISGVLFFLMLYLVPQLMSFITVMNQELPLHTKFLIATSDFFVAYWYLILSLPVVAFFALRAFARVSPSTELAVDRIKLKIWVVGPIMRKIILSRFASFFALMYSSGISILDCIRKSEDMVGNKAISEGMRQIARQIEDGWSISAAFESVGLFPPLVLRMIKVGETTGALDTALLNISYFYSRDVRESIEKVQSMIEPTMTVVLGSILAWVMISVLGPIYDLITNIKI